VLAIFQKALTHGSSRINSHGIFSCFTQDSLQGSIYVEAQSFPAVVNILHGISGVVRRAQGGPPVIKIVHIKDMPLLLSMERSTIKPSSWVRIKAGLYKGDLGLVRDVDTLSHLCDVYVVPRLAYGTKGKCGNRPPPALFDMERVERVFNSKVEIRNQALLFEEKLYLFGMYVAEFHMLKLTSEGVNVTHEELQHFQHLPEWEEAREFISPLKVGDRVRVVSGLFKGGWGITSEIKQTSLCLIWEDNQQDAREVLIRDVRKLFHLGDFVQILYGPNRGDEGFVVHLHGEVVVIYKRRGAGVLGDQLSGCEVSKFLVRNIYGKSLSLSYQVAANIQDIYWQSTPENFISAPRESMINSHATLSRSGKSNSVAIPHREPDRYKHMAVQIVQGALKGNFGTIIGTHWSKRSESKAGGNLNEYEELAVVETETQAIKSCRSYRLEELRERQ
jgi:ribosomal protein L24